MSDFLKRLGREILVLDGSMGALLQNRGLPNGMAPDVWMMDNPDIILNAHQEYADAGADILLTNTFGATRWRLDEYDAGARLREINAKAVDLARRASKGRAFVAGDIGPSGDTIFPTGKKSFEEACEIFFEQAKVLVELGVDLIAIETMFDSLEFRCALSAVRAASSTIPLVAFATFNTDGITDTGATPENIAAIAEGFRCHAVGVNCSTGPEPMVGVVRRMAATTGLAVAVQPNAGLPALKGGRNVFPLGPHEMEPFIDQFIEAGAAIIGGCCGTTPEYIRLVKNHAEKNPKVRYPAPASRVIISSLSTAVPLGGGYPFVAIGERMNPSGRKKLSASLKAKDLTLLLEDADLQVASGARVMDLNVGVPMVDEPALMRQAVAAVQTRHSAIPLMIDSADSRALEAGASVYYGRPLLNSLNAEAEKLDEVIPIVKKHGAAVVALLTGVDVPVRAEERLKNARAMTELLFGRHGLSETDVVFDCLGLVVSAMQEGARETLRTIEMIKEYYPRAATTLGLSNVSFGLPNRKFVHGSFLACAAQRGLDTAIMSVTDPIGKILADASLMFGAKPDTISHYMKAWPTPLEIGGVGEPKLPTSAKEASTSKEPAFVGQLPELEAGIFRAILEGEKDKTETLVRRFAEKQPQDAMRLFVEVMTPAIRHLGDLFGARVKFIPHLIAAAEAMKMGAGILEPLLIAARASSGETKGTIVFATVKGDIHDIGKNICILMLRNFGFEVIDLGRNVDSDLIIKTAIERKAQVIALSALMTTTMMQMKVVVDKVREGKIPCKVVVGGAVVTPEFAREIQADAYSKDVGTVTSDIERLMALLKATGVSPA